MGMCSQNEHTGALQRTKAYSEEGRENFDKIDWSNAPWKQKAKQAEEVKENTSLPEGYEEKLQKYSESLTAKEEQIIPEIWKDIEKSFRL